MKQQHLADYLEASAARFPDRIAVVDPNGHRVTYDDLNRQVDALAGFLSARGVKRGDRVGVVLPKGIPAVVSLFGIMKAGAVYVPVDFTAPRERGRHILTDCEISAAIVDSRSISVLPEPAGTAPACEVVIVTAPPPVSEVVGHTVTSFECALKEGADIPVTAERGSNDLAYIIYTSGSTGLPKGAMITQSSAVSFVDWCSLSLEPSENDRFGSHTPFHFDASVQDIYPAIKHGAALHLISEELAKAPKDLARFIGERELTVWSSTPSAMITLLQFGNLDARGPWHLRVVSFGGEIFPIKHLRELKRRWVSPVYYNMYGPTETTTTCTFGRIPDVIPDDREEPYPIGFACSHCQAVALDDKGQEVAAGQEGVLHISGPSVFAGYWRRPAETAAAFLDRAGVRWYNTGDVVRWDPVDGFTYVGRNDRMVKRRGYRIELGEIERALYLHESVREAAVVSLPDRELGVTIVAFLSCTDGAKPTIIELKAFLATRLPGYMSPDRFVFHDRLPRTSTEKVDYQALRARLLSSSGRQFAHNGTFEATT